MMRKGFLEKVRVTLWGSKQLFIAAPKEMSLISSLIVIQGVLPAFSLFLVLKIIDWISKTEIGFDELIWFLALWGGALTVSTMIAPFISMVRLHLNEKMLAHSNLLLMKKANSIESLEAFENPELYDQIQFLKDESARRPLNFVFIATSIIRDLVTLAAVLLLIATLNPWIPFLVLIICIPHAVSTYWFEKQTWTDALFRSPEARRLSWLASLSMDERFAKEVRLFGFGDFLIKKYLDSAKNFGIKFNRERWKKSVGYSLISLVSVLGNIGIFAFVVFLAKRGEYSAGAVIVALQGLVMTQLELNGLIQDFGMLSQTMLFFRSFRDFLNRDFAIASNHRVSTDPLLRIRTVAFEDVSFSYGDGRQALSNVSFKVHAGQKIAIVGENGAGKSTLVKLLCAFYQPSEGKIEVDKVPLDAIEPADWRKRLSVVFQDFGQYYFTVGENISISKLDALDSQIRLAAKKSEFESVIEKLPKGLDTQLGKQFGGTALSGGEWQKLAMSRAFLRDAEILILDEPTASLDPKSEHAVYQRFAENSKGKTTFFITHRLGSVRMADRILVLKEGRLVEEGTHEELMQKKGEYAHLFSMQAAKYSTRNIEELVSLA